MAGSIKIQHGGTASTPQAGFSTLWVKSSDGEFYYTKPDGSVESLVGPTGAQGSIGPVGATGIGLGLNAKNFGITGGQFTYVGGGSPYSYIDITFAQSFASTNYSIDFQYLAESNANGWSDFFGVFSPVEIANKTSSGFRITVAGVNIPSSYPNLVGYVQAIALGEYGVSYYGNFYSTVSQTNAGATAANVITYNTTDLSSGVSIVSSSRITIANAGIYNIQFSAQLQKNSGGDDAVDIWLVKNGTAVPNSNTRTTLTANPAYNVAAWNFLVQANAGDYYQLYWSSSDTTAQIHAASASTDPTRPAIPSVILSVTQVSAA